MSEFWHEPQTDTLIYPGALPPHVAPFLPDAKPLNGSYFAVPRTLRNSIVLAQYNYPVMPVMDGYDFPIEPGKKPLPHQKIYANFSVLHPKMFNLGDPGCVAGGTLIETDKGPVRIDALTAQGKNIKVYASTDEGVRLVKAECPFVKGFEPIYRVTFESGKTIDVTARHIFLTTRGWVSCADLEVGAQMPKFDVARPVSTSESYLSELRRGAPRSKRTGTDFPEHCYNPVHGGPLRQAEDSVQVSIPSQDGALEHLRYSWRMDDLGTKHKSSFQLSDAHLSNSGCYRQPSCDGRVCSIYESTSTPSCSQHRSASLSHQSSCPPQPSPRDSEESCGCAHYLERIESRISERSIESSGNLPRTDRLPFEPTSRPQLNDEVSRRTLYPVVPSDTPVDTVVSITYIKTDVYYDMHVPVYENYIAHGICNHNTMKTLSTLWAMDFLMQQFEPGTCRALVIAPLSILETVWAAAIFRNFPGRRTFKVLIGDADRRMRLLAEPADVYILNPDGLKIGAHIKKRPKPGERRITLDGFSAALAARKDIRMVIVDEASAFKDDSTYKHHIIRMALGDRPFCWLLTGTPTPNSPADAHGLAKLVNNAFGKSFTAFRLESMIKISEFKWVPQRDGYDKARRLLTPSVRFALDDVWAGPPMTFQRRKIELTPDQKKAMADLKRDLQVLTKGGAAIAANNEAAARQKFIQISLGMIYDDKHSAHVIDARPRYAELYDIIESTQRKVVVFVVITAAIHLMMDYVRKQWRAERLGWKCDYINGEVPAKKRPGIIKSFVEDENLKVIFADPVAAGHGINEFVEADTVIWASATDKTESFIQGNARVRRPGQKYPTTCHQIVSNKLEEEIFDRLETNTGMQGMMLSAIREGKF